MADDGKKGGGLFGTLKGVAERAGLISVEEDAGEGSPAGSEVKAPSANTPQPTIKPAPRPVIRATEEENPFVGVLRKAVVGQGTALLKFLTSVKDFMSSGLDEKASFIAARTVAGKEGVTPEQILNGFSTRKTALATEAEEMRKALDIQEGKVKTKTDGIANIDANIERRRTDIQRLNSEIAELEQQRKQQTDAIAADQAKIVADQAKIEAAIMQVGAEIEEEMERVSSLIKGGQ